MTKKYIKTRIAYLGGRVQDRCDNRDRSMGALRDVAELEYLKYLKGQGTKSSFVNFTAATSTAAQSIFRELKTKYGDRK